MVPAAGNHARSFRTPSTDAGDARALPLGARCLAHSFWNHPVCVSAEPCAGCGSGNVGRRQHHGGSIQLSIQENVPNRFRDGTGRHTAGGAFRLCLLCAHLHHRPCTGTQFIHSFLFAGSTFFNSLQSHCHDTGVVLERLPTANSID